MAKFKIKIIDGEKKYTSLYGTLEEHNRHYNRLFSAKSSVRVSLSCLCIDRDYSVYPGEKRFCWGISDYEKVNDLVIEGQRPTAVIPYTACDNQSYFWYYEDIQSDKPFDEMEFTFE